MMSTTTERSGQMAIPQGTEQAHTLVVLIHDRPGAVDRVVGLLRRRRANMQTIILGRSTQADVVRVTIGIDDSQVSVDQLVEQLRKIVDVVEVTNLAAQEAITRELALIKINATGSQVQEILDYGQRFAAHIIEVTTETVTLEIVSSEDQIEHLLEGVTSYGVREIARSGNISIARGKNA